MNHIRERERGINRERSILLDADTDGLVMIHKISKTEFYIEAPAAVSDNIAKNREVHDKKGGGRLELIHNSDHMKECVCVRE